MGRLTDDMSRLRGEIDILHSGRETFIKDLKRDVAQIKTDVAQMQTGFLNDRGEMARRIRTEHGAFLSNLKSSVSELKKTVASLRQEIVDDITGARRAWSGPPVNERRATEEAERQRKERAEAHGKGRETSQGTGGT